MILVLKVILFGVLATPALALTLLIWLFGGWTKGWGYMPNPMYALINWVEG